METYFKNLLLSEYNEKERKVNKMAGSLPNIIYDNIGKTSIIDSPTSPYLLEFNKSEEFFSSLESRTRFLKDCERLVRDNDRYNKYIHRLKTKVKLNRCQVLSGLTDMDCTVEMHHGPIFTLYDYCDIILDFYLQKGWDITTFRIAKHVLDEHWADRIQVVMLSITIHQEVHDREMFLNMQQAWGDLHSFLKRYRLHPDLKDKYDRYVDRSMMLDSTTYDLLKLNERLFKKED